MLGVSGLLVSVLFSHVVISNGLFRPQLENIPFALSYYFVMAGPLVITMGGIFPIICSLSASSDRELPGRTGILYIVNSVGAFSGALLAQFLGFTWLGTPGVLTLLVLLGMAGAFFLTTGVNSFRKLYAGLATVPVLLLGALFVSGGWSSYIHGPEVARGVTVSEIEGQTGIAAIAWESGERQGKLFIGGQPMGLVPNEPKTIQQISAALTLPDRDKILVLGLGGSGYLRELVKDKSTLSIDVIDWSHELPQLLRTERAVNAFGDPLGDPRVKIHRGDARLAVNLLAAKQFDIVIDDLAYPTWVGATGIRSASFMANVARVLKPTGFYVLTTNYVRWRGSMLAGLAASFTHIHENMQAHVVISGQQALQPDPQRARVLSAEYADRAKLDPEQFAAILTQGYLALDLREFSSLSPITEDRFFTEYYMALPQFLRHLQ